jgi:hypothetical protein
VWTVQQKGAVWTFTDRRLQSWASPAAAAAQAEAELAKTWVGDRQLLQISNL